MFVWKATLLKFSDPNMVKDWSHRSVKVFHECREILLEHSNNEIRPIICRLVAKELRGNFRPTGIFGKVIKKVTPSSAFQRARQSEIFAADQEGE
jgi:hypothetical protein